MGDVADPGSYQEVMNQLAAYTSRVFEHCANMRSAAGVCVSTMGDDPAAAKSVAALEKCLNQIQSGLEAVNQVRAAMARELDDIQRAAARADF